MRSSTGKRVAPSVVNPQVTERSGIKEARKVSVSSGKPNDINIETVKDLEREIDYKCDVGDTICFKLLNDSDSDVDSSDGETESLILSHLKGK